MNSTLRSLLFFVVLIPVLLGFNYSTSENSANGSCCISVIIFGMSDPTGYYVSAGRMDNGQIVGTCIANSHGECTICDLPEGVALKVGVESGFIPCAPVTNVYCDPQGVSVPLTCNN